MPKPILVSACLLGLSTRYDGQSKLNEKVLNYLRNHNLVPVPVCPEQLAGLPTPRPKTFFATGSGPEVLDDRARVIREDLTIMNDVFIRGAMETLKVAHLVGCDRALFKDGSPSCGVHRICRAGSKVAGQGITTALLLRNGLQVFSEENL
jgi:uncharacterized protein YbbK (DUF523 family)